MTASYSSTRAPKPPLTPTARSTTKTTHNVVQHTQCKCVDLTPLLLFALTPQPLRRAGGTATEARRLAACIKEWRSTLAQPPPAWLNQLHHTAANMQNGVYHNAQELLDIKAVPRPGNYSLQFFTYFSRAHSSYFLPCQLVCDPHSVTRNVWMILSWLFFMAVQFRW